MHRFVLQPLGTIVKCLWNRHQEDEGDGDGADGGVGEVDAVGGDGVDQVRLELCDDEGTEPVEAGNILSMTIRNL